VVKALRIFRTDETDIHGFQTVGWDSVTSVMVPDMIKTNSVGPAQLTQHAM